MTHHSIRISGIFIALIVILAIFTLPVTASPFLQQPDQTDRIRPDQYAYHGREDIPVLNSPILNSNLENSISSPVEEWSKMVFQSYTEDNWDIFSANGDFTNLVRLTNNGNLADIHPHLNRGGTQIVFSSDRAGSAYHIYLMNSDGSNQTRLTQSAADDVYPAWSPDGTRIAFQSYRDGNAEVYVMNADGSGQTNLTMSGDYDGMPSWSPDGTKITFISRRTNYYHVWVMNADGSQLVELSQQRYCEAPTWSPDGSYISYDADNDEDGWQELWYMLSDGSLQTLLADPSTNTTYWANGWSPDGEFVTYTGVHMVYYYGNWYWDSAWLGKLSLIGYSYRINPNRYTDWELDWTTVDVQPPSTGLNTLFTPLPYTFTISWWGLDDLAGISTFDVQVRDGRLGTWKNWQERTSNTSAVYTGVGGHEYYFRVRGFDRGFNIQPWPADYQVYTAVENFPPFTSVNGLDPLIYGNRVTVSWGGYDVGRSGILAYDLQYRMNVDGIWQEWLSNTTSTSAIFTGEPGHTYYFRSRGTDMAVNVEDWPAGVGDASTSFYSWFSMGSVSDNTGVPISNGDVSVEPAAFLSFPSSVEGIYSAYLAEDPPNKTVTWSKDDYGVLSATIYGQADANVNVVLPPTDNQVQNWGFESGILPDVWQAGGIITPTLDETYFHNGSYAAFMGSPTDLGTPVWISGTLQLNEMFNPFAFDSHGGVHMAWADWNNGYHIYYSYRLPDQSWSPAELVTVPDNFVSLVRIMVDNNKNVHLVYALDTYGIFYSRRDTNGNWSTPEVISPDGWLQDFYVDDSTSIHLLISMNPSLNYAHLTIGGNWQIETIPDIKSFNWPDLVVDSSGEVHLAWTFSTYAGSGVGYMLRQADGSWTEPVVISKASWPYSINILLDSYETPHVVWSDNVGQITVLRYSHQNMDGSWSDAYRLSGEMSAGQFNMLIDNQDSLYFVWVTNSGDVSTNGIYFVQKDNKEIWSHPLKISQSINVPHNINASISGGDIYAVWEEETELNTDVYYSRQHAGIWSSPVQLTNTPIYSARPHIELDPMGGVNIAWSETNDSDIHELYYLGSLPLPQAADTWLAQSFTIPLTITHPTLSFLASLSGVSEISGDDFSVLVSSAGISTPLFRSVDPTAWEHFWIDMTPWSGQEITLTFRLKEDADYPPASALLDEVTLGEAHSDVWADLTGLADFAHPGDQVVYMLDYGNRAGIPAAATAITMTLPAGLDYLEASIPPTIIGNQLVWQVGDVPAESTFGPIYVTVEVSASAPLFQNVTTNAEIVTSSPELEKLNNYSQVEMYLAFRQLLALLVR
jgi:Tol biopolymer transport system component